VLYGVSHANIDRLRVQNVLARVVAQAPLTISSIHIRRDLHWLPVNHRIRYKLSLLTWKALHTAEPYYLSELISPYVPSRTLRSSNTCRLAIPTGVTSHFSSRSFSASVASTYGTLYLYISTLERILLPLSVNCSHISFSLPLLSSHPVPAPLIYYVILVLYKFVCMNVCMYVRLVNMPGLYINNS